MFGVLSHAHVQLRILTPLLDWKRCSSSQSSPFSSSCIVRSNISAGVPKPFNLFDTFFLVVGSVAIHLGYLNASLFLSRKVDQLRMLSRLSLDFTATGNTPYFHVIGVVSIFNYRLEVLYKLSVVLIFSHIVRSIRTICTTRTIQDSLQIV